MASTFSQAFVLHVTSPLWSGGETSQLYRGEVTAGHSVTGMMLSY